MAGRPGEEHVLQAAGIDYLIAHGLYGFGRVVVYGPRHGHGGIRHHHVTAVLHGLHGELVHALGQHARLGKAARCASRGYKA